MGVPVNGVSVGASFPTMPGSALSKAWHGASPPTGSADQAFTFVGGKASDLETFSSPCLGAAAYSRTAQMMLLKSADQVPARCRTPLAGLRR